MPYHPEHTRLSQTQMIVAGLLVLLLAISLLWSFQEGRARTRTEPTPAVTPAAAEPSSIEPAAAAAGAGSTPR
jgi:hypothetical protein